MKLFRTIETTAYNGYKVGDVIAFTLNDGEEVEALAVKQEADGMIFYLVDCLREEDSMNPIDSTRGRYMSCELRNALNTKILNRFPAEIRNNMIAFPNGDFLRLATEREIFGANIYGEVEGVRAEQWEPMKDRRNRISFHGNKTGRWEWYWLQNKSKGSTNHFVNVGCDGFVACEYASVLLGVRPAFKIKYCAS